MLITLCMGIICCMLYFVFIIFSDGYEESWNIYDIVNLEKKDVSNKSNVNRILNTEYKEIRYDSQQNKSCCVKSIFINDIMENFKKYKFYSGSDQSTISDNKILNELYEFLHVKKLKDHDLRHLPRCTEYEKQYNNLKLETLKVNNEYYELQERIDNLSRGKNSKEFNKLPSDIKSLAQENICDEQIYLYKKKNENLNKLWNLHFEMINLLYNISK